MNSNEVESFAKQVASLRLNEVDNAVALLWFHDHHGIEKAMPARQLATLLDDLGLSSGANASRLSKKLAAHAATTKARDRFRLRLSERETLDGVYLPLLKKRRTVVVDAIIPSGQLRVRPYLASLEHQINGSYTHEFYDGCAILCRRLVLKQAKRELGRQ